MFKLLEGQGDHAEAVQDLCKTTLRVLPGCLVTVDFRRQECTGTGAQKRVVKLMTNLRSKTYEGRLKELGLTSLVERRKRVDMITMFRIMTGKEKVDPGLWFSMTTPRSGAASTRQNTGWRNVEKPPRSSMELRRNQFSQRAVDDWNLLPDWVKQAGTFNSFKNSLDKHRYAR